MSAAPVFAKLAVFGVGALLGSAGIGAFVGVAWPVDQLIDTLFHGIDAARRRSLQTLCGCLADDLDRLVTGDPGTREAARLKAEELVRDFGLSDAAFAEQDLDPARAAEAVLGHGHFATQSEATELREPVRRILACFYERLPARPELLAGLLPHIHQATLRRLRRIEDEQTRQGEEQRRQTALLQQIAAAVAAAEHVPNEVLLEILSRFGEAEIAADRAVIEQRLRAKAEEYRALEAQLHRLSNDDPEVNRLRGEAADLIAAARLEEANEKLATAEALDLSSINELEQIIQRRRISAAESRAQRGAIERLVLNYHTAAEHFAAAAQLVESTDLMTRVAYLEDEIDALYIQGKEFGDNAALELAVERSLSLLALVPRKQAPMEWAGTQMRLGLALTTLGEREGSSTKLMEAVGAFEKALLEYKRERVPLDWASAQNSLGNVLQALGRYEEGTAKLLASMTAYRQALQEYTRERAPLEWSRVQNNLGNTLRLISEREPGTARLVESIEAYRNALSELRREVLPLEWAMAQNNLGTALTNLGRRRNEPGMLFEAVSAYREALLERTHERVPLDWAVTQNNLGSVLAMLGERERGTDLLVEAETAYRAALSERTRDRMPLEWATTQNNLGNVLWKIGEREPGTARLVEAVATFQAALMELRRERVPLQWAETQNNLGSTLWVLAQRTRQVSLLDDAEAALSRARQVIVVENGRMDLRSYFDNGLNAIRAFRAYLLAGH